MSHEMTQHEFKTFRDFISDVCGIEFGDDKVYLVENRLSGLLAESGFFSFDELFRHIYNNIDKLMIERLIDAITTNETFWFRDKAPWFILEKCLLPEYIKQLRASERSNVRIWSAACSTGQEPYSTAMCIQRYIEKNGIDDISLSQFEILATDISGVILKIAGMGRYDNISITRGLSDEYRDRYFKCIGKTWDIDPKIKDAVRLMKFNLQDDFLPLGKFDIIFCRNVLIYFSDKLKREVLSKAAEAFRPGGVVFIGSSELMPEPGCMFSAKQHGDAMYYEVKG